MVLQMRACEFTRTSVFKTAGWDQTMFITLATTAAAGLVAAGAAPQRCGGRRGCFRSRDWGQWLPGPSGGGRLWQ